LWHASAIWQRADALSRGQPAALVLPPHFVGAAHLSGETLSLAQLVELRLPAHPLSPVDRIDPDRHDRSLDSRLQPMRYTKTALLAFGLGLLLGMVVVAAELKSLARVASGLMALGIAAIPIGMIMDWRRAARASRRAVGRRAKAPAVRPRRSARPKR
jgi:hypothetical protein